MPDTSQRWRTATERDRAESPQYPLQGADWLTGIAYWVDPEHKAPEQARKWAELIDQRQAAWFEAKERLDREQSLAVATTDGLNALQQDLDARYQRLRNTIASAFRKGLEHRIDWPILKMTAGWDLPTFRTFLLIAGEMPRRFSVCSDCGHIFRPARKSQAKRCVRCDKRGPVADTFGGSVDAQTGIVYSAPTPKGWRTFRNPRCEECREFFVATRADARFCSEGCKSAANRRAA